MQWIACCNVIGNTDGNMTPHIVKAIMNPSEVPELTMHKLAGVILYNCQIFSLQMVVPFINTWIKRKLNATRRQSAVIRKTHVKTC